MIVSMKKSQGLYQEKQNPPRTNSKFNKVMGHTHTHTHKSTAFLCINNERVEIEILLSLQRKLIRDTFS